jgi:hypothetical protein
MLNRGFNRLSIAGEWIKRHLFKKTAEKDLIIEKKKVDCTRAGKQLSGLSIF